MKVNLIDMHKILITPETDFEERYLSKWQGRERKVVLKCGLSLSEVVGLEVSAPHCEVKHKPDELSKKYMDKIESDTAELCKKEKQWWQVLSESIWHSVRR